MYCLWFCDYCILHYFLSSSKEFGIVPFYQLIACQENRNFLSISNRVMEMQEIIYKTLERRSENRQAVLTQTPQELRYSNAEGTVIAIIRMADAQSQKLRRSPGGGCHLMPMLLINTRGQECALLGGYWIRLLPPKQHNFINMETCCQWNLGNTVYRLLAFFYTEKKYKSLQPSEWKIPQTGFNLIFSIFNLFLPCGNLFSYLELISVFGLEIQLYFF